MKNKNVGATSSRPHIEEITKRKNETGITLIALIITIIVMLILVVVSVRIALSTGLFESAGKAGKDWKTAQDEEKQLAGGQVTIGNKTYNSIDEYVNCKDEKYFGLIVTAETEDVLYKDKDGNIKELTEEVEDGDIVEYGNYVYRYNMYLDVNFADTTSVWVNNTNQNGWGVEPMYWLDKEDYGELCGEILGKPVNNLSGTFYFYNRITQAPRIPESVVYMRHSFRMCTSLENPPTIPEGVVDMTGTFAECFSLTGKLIINANPTSYDECLYRTSTIEGSSLVLKGKCDTDVLAEIEKTGVIPDYSTNSSIDNPNINIE